MCIPGQPAAHLPAQPLLDTGQEAVARVRVAPLVLPVQLLLPDHLQVEEEPVVPKLLVLQGAHGHGHGQGVPGL